MKFLRKEKRSFFIEDKKRSRKVFGAPGKRERGG